MLNNTLFLVASKKGLYHKNFHNKGIPTVMPDITSFIILFVIDGIFCSAAVLLGNTMHEHIEWEDKDN